MKDKLLIEQWSPNLIGFCDNLNHSKVEDKLVKRCLYLKNKIESGGKNWISNKTYNTYNTYNIMNDKNFILLNKWVLNKIDEYGKSLKYKNKFICKEAWFNIYEKNDYQEYHSHKAFISLSAVYYLISNPKTCAKTFFDFEHKRSSNIEIDSSFALTSPLANYEAVPGRLLIFDSTLRHCVERQETDDLRISLAYNFI